MPKGWHRCAASWFDPFNRFAIQQATPRHRQGASHSPRPITHATKSGAIMVRAKVQGVYRLNA